MEKKWTQEKLQQLIAIQAEENIHLEFKEGKALGLSEKQKVEICKDVSAFANADGGQIIYGIKEIDHKAGAISPVDGNVMNKEWLENVISSGIHQRIDTIVITPIRIDGAMEKTIYIVDIPVSSRAPHMVNGRYYKRYNFKAVPMEEYEVRQLYLRRHKTTLAMGQSLVRIGNAENWQQDGYFDVHIDYYVKNSGTNVAEQYRVRCSLPRVTDLKYNFSREKNYGFTTSGNTVFVFIKESIPLFPEEEITILSFGFQIPKDKLEWLQDFLIKVTLYTDNGNQGFTHEIGNTVRKMINKLTGESLQ